MVNSISAFLKTQFPIGAKVSTQCYRFYTAQRLFGKRHIFKWENTILVLSEGQMANVLWM